MPIGSPRARARRWSSRSSPARSARGLDSVVRLLDASGKVVAENNDIDLNRDSVLTWRFTDAGTYAIAIEDLEHGGGADGFGYRIYAGVLPYLTGVFPLGVRGGAAATWP